MSHGLRCLFYRFLMPRVGLHKTRKQGRRRETGDILTPSWLKMRLGMGHLMLGGVLISSLVPPLFAGEEKGGGKGFQQHEQSLRVEAALREATDAAARSVVPTGLPYVIGAAYIAWAAYEIYATYQKEGPEAALEKAGVEGVTIVVGGVVLKTGFKVAGRIYPSAQKAWSAYLSQSPEMSRVLNSVGRDLEPMKKALVDSRVGRLMGRVGQAFVRADQGVDVTATKVGQAITHMDQATAHGYAKLRRRFRKPVSQSVARKVNLRTGRLLYKEGLIDGHGKLTKKAFARISGNLAGIKQVLGKSPKASRTRRPSDQERVTAPQLRDPSAGQSRAPHPLPSQKGDRSILSPKSARAPGEESKQLLQGGGEKKTYTELGRAGKEPSS